VVKHFTGQLAGQAG